MNGWVAAFAVSFGAHAAVAALFAAYFAICPAAPELPRLDLSAVELEFSAAEESLETAPSEEASAADAEASAPESFVSSVSAPEPPDPASGRLDAVSPRPTDASASALSAPELALPPADINRAAAADSGAPTARVDATPRPLDENALRPVYPRVSKQRGEEGMVVVVATVGADGVVKDVEVEESSGFAALDAAAQRTVSAARFAPAVRGGRAVEAAVRLPIEFRLTDYRSAGGGH